MNKVTFITGSGKRRVGNVIAREAAKRGFDVALHYRESEKEARETSLELAEFGIRCEIFQADLANAEDTVSLCQRVLGSFGRVDLLVTAAAIWKQEKLESTSAALLEEHFRINTLATFLCAQQIGLAMCKQETGGTIVTIGDWAVARPYDHFSAYFLSKGAIPTLTINLANELGHRNPLVRVNCIHPGAVLLPENMSNVEKRGVVEKSLTKSLGTPEQVAQVVFSFYDNSFLSGVCLPVDGGESISNGAS